jgi:TolA-binding protein
VSENDRHMSGSGPARVRLAALVELRAGANHEGSEGNPRPALSGEVSGNAGHVSGNVRPVSGVMSEEAASTAATDALIDQLRGEVAFLRSALEREQETARAALRELNEERQRGMILLAATAAGRIQPLDGSQTSAGAGQDMPKEARQSTDTNDTAPAAVSVPDAPETKRGLFARLFGR